MNLKRRSIRGDGRGNMPFALVAVTILVLASAYGVVASQAEDAGDRAGNIETEIDLIGESARAIGRFVERGMGEIIYGISTDAKLADMSQREAEFKRRADEWLEFQFPAEDSGVKATLRGHDLSLGARQLRAGGDLAPAEGYVPAYLVARGTVDAVFESDSGRSERTLDIESDGSCALPLALSAGSMFANAVGGDDSVLSQMMVYQLSALAQTRVLNGYGATLEYGPGSVAEIITRADVDKAYRNSLAAISILYFRSADGGEMFRGDVDMAKTFVAPDGYVTVDLNAVYAQMLAVYSTTIAENLFGYFMGNKILEICDHVDDKLRDAFDTLTSWLTGRNDFSAAPYLHEAAPDADFDVRTGESYLLHVAISADSGPADAAVPVPYPDADLLDTHLVKNFRSEYRADTDALRDWLTKIVNRTVRAVAGTNPIGAVRIPVDGPGTYSEILSARVTAALDGGERAFEEAACRELSRDRYPDQFRAAIYERIMEERDSIFSYDIASFRASAEDGVRAGVEAYAREHPEAGVDVDAAVGNALSGDELADIHREYCAEVDALLESISALETAETSKIGVVERACVGILKSGMLAAETVVGLTPYVEKICREFADSISSAPYSGYASFPEDDSFALGPGGSSRERMSVSLSADPAVTVGMPSRSSSLHFARGSEMQSVFTAGIPVRVVDTLPFDVTTSDPLMEGLGLNDSASRGRAEVSLDLEIPVVSGWRLAGVDYREARTAAGDLMAAAATVLEPVLEPLRKTMRIAMEMFDGLRDAVAELGSRAAERVSEIYGRIAAPLRAIGDIASGKLGAAFSGAVCAAVDIAGGHQRVAFNIAGMAVALTFDAASLGKSTKSILRAEMTTDTDGDGKGISAYLDFKLQGRADPRPIVTGGFGIVRDGWSVRADIDPLMAVSEHLLAVSGTVRGVAIDAVVPELVQYRQADLRLSDVPALGTMLSNIPSPVPGTKLAVDAGLALKYSAPIASGVLINEIESNPEGPDADNEWAEIVNLSRRSVDISGWILRESSGGREHVIPGGTVLAPGARTVVRFPGNFLLNGGDSLSISDASGNVVDTTPTCRDAYNDSRTFQRGFDGSTDWVMHERTPGTRNEGGLLGKEGAITAQAIEIFKDAAGRAMREMKKVKSVEALGELFERIILYAIGEGIGRLSSCLVEATAYVRVGISDPSSSLDADFVVYLRADEQLAEDLLRYVAGHALALFTHFDDPYKVNLGEALADGTCLGVAVFAGISPPPFLHAGGLADEIDVGVDVSCNASSVAALFGKDVGTPRVTAGVNIRNCPTAAIPAALRPDPSMQSDLWLLRMSFKPAERDRLRGGLKTPPANHNMRPRDRVGRGRQWTHRHRRYRPF